MAYPILWVPASSQDFLRGRSGVKPIAIVHHRMVGALSGTDSTFQSSANRAVSTHFGIGYESGRLEIHQYVDLTDTAFGNGNYDSSGSWDNWGYPTSLINGRTVSIEHQDNAQLPSTDPRRGIVPEEVIRASIWLDRLLLTGDLAKIREAGIRCRYSGTAAALGAIAPGPRTLITHNDIAGKLKPYCWLPWAKDTVGFPRSRYVSELTSRALKTEVADMADSFITPEARTLAKVKAKTWLYDNGALQPSAGNVQVDPGRELVYVGQLTASPDIRIVAYEPAAGDTNTASKAMFVPAVGIESYRNAPDPTPFSEAQLDQAVADALAAQKAALDAAAAALAAEQAKSAALTTKLGAARVKGSEIAAL
jgi:hypothetical protein